jgi:short-subunit dehydrogenase
MAVLITGASQGIGLELARLFAADGAELILTARDEERLHRVAADLGSAGSRIHVIAADLTVPDRAKKLYSEAKELGGPIHTLINNAGFGSFGPFSETDIDAELSMIQLNVSALTVLTKLAASDMIRAGSGRILNVASTAAFQPGPYVAVYYATKAYVLSLSEALHEELRGTGVTVTTLCPGPTKTAFQARAGMQRSRLTDGALVASAADVARDGYRAMKKGKRRVIAGLSNRLFVGTVRFLPRALVLRIIRTVQESRTSQ